MCISCSGLSGMEPEACTTLSMMHEDLKKTLERYLNGTYTGEEAADVFSSVKEQENQSLIEEAASRVWQETAGEEYFATAEESHSEEKEAAALLARHGRTRRKTRVRHIAVAALAAAASLAALVVIFRPFAGNRAETPVYGAVSTGFGEKRQVLLPDGTFVMLNSCSEIRYPASFPKGLRSVELAGEAYFDVARDEDKPFVIHTEGFDVRVLGTSFNVKAYEGDKLNAVDVERGLVQVDLQEAMLRLHADEKLVMDRNSGRIEKMHDNRETSLWRKGQLDFDATPIRDVAKMLEREYGCRIYFQEGQDFDNLISGRHDNKSLNAVLKAIEFAGGIKIRKEGNNILFYKP